ncbi:MAG: TCR/Tet family MFS transporter [Thermoanaerobaculia bacterium]|nr:TCR/Tet family MFS transporter [Thermoanaerobaculia bacterium]
MVFIFATLLIDVLGIGLVVPVLPELVKGFVGGEVTAAGRWYGVLAAVYALMQFLFAPILGALSDRFGRRPVLLISLFGLGVDYVVMGLAPSLWWLFAARVFSGIMGASITTGNAYIADISTPENRARNFGLVGVAFGVGFVFGPALGGMLGSVHLRLPFFVAAGLSLVNWLYGFFVLPESLPREHRSSFSWRKANPVGSLQILRSYPLVGGLAAAFVLMSLAQRGLESTWVLYTGYRFGWDERTNGLALALVGIMAVIVQGFLVKPVVGRLGERRSVLFGLFWGSLAYAGYGLATSGSIVLITIVLGSIAGVAGPSIQALVSGSVTPSDQGKVQGALTSLMSLSSIVAPLLFVSGLFSFFTSDAAPFELPGAPFFLGMVCFFSAGLVVLRLFRRIPAGDGHTEGQQSREEGRL